MLIQVIFDWIWIYLVDISIHHLHLEQLEPVHNYVGTKRKCMTVTDPLFSYWSKIVVVVGGVVISTERICVTNPLISY